MTLLSWIMVTLIGGYQLWSSLKFRSAKPSTTKLSFCNNKKRDFLLNIVFIVASLDKIMIFLEPIYLIHNVTKWPLLCLACVCYCQQLLSTDSCMLVEITSHVLKLHSVGVRKYNSPAWYCIYCIFGSNFNLFFLQLYKTRDDKYLLDMQRVTGPQLLFLEFCAAFLTSLRVL